MGDGLSDPGAATPGEAEQVGARHARYLPFRGPAMERLSEDRRWRRIHGGLRYLRRYGFAATLRRLFPALQTYRVWVRSYDTLTRDDVGAIAMHIREMSDRPVISLLLPVDPSEIPMLPGAIEGILGQLYPDWELCIVAGPTVMESASALAARYADRRIKLVEIHRGEDFAQQANAALAAATGGFAALLNIADELPPHALYMVAVELNRHPDAVLLYSDEDAIGARGRRFNPQFKSDWNPDLLLGCDMIGRLAAYRRDLAERLGGFRTGFDGAEEYDLVLRASEQARPEQIRHIPFILYHRRCKIVRMSEGKETFGSFCRAVRQHLARTDTAATVTPLAGRYTRAPYHPLPEPPPGVSLIVPTRDRVSLLRRCVDGLLFATDYSNLEVVIVDNDSARADTHAYFAELKSQPRVRFLRYPGAFNYSAINNFAVAEAQHDIIGLINNDIEVIDAHWLREMVSHAIRPEVGAVGAKLYYPNDRIQHAGTIVGLGGAAGHAFRHFKRADPGYCGRLMLTQNLSAVTAACMLLRKEIFCEVGGFDEVNLAIAFNDVDLCLRIRECGYRIVWTPNAELYHWESVSRGSDLAPEKIERFRRENKYLAERWPAVIAHDPYYNPNLTLEREDFGLAFPPRTMPPWRNRRDS
jgi:GT2 family glycosyltransferase